MFSPYARLFSLASANDQLLQCTVDAVGPSHSPEFTANVSVQRMPTLSAQGQGKTKKHAQHRAANEVLHKIKDRLEELKWNEAEFLKDYDFDSFELSVKAKESPAPTKNFISVIHEFYARERYNLSPIVSEKTLNGPNPNNFSFQITVVLPDIKDQNGLPVETMASSSKKQIAKNEAFEKMYDLLKSMGYNLEAPSKGSQMRHVLTSDENDNPSPQQVISGGATSDNQWNGSFNRLKKFAEEKEMTLDIKESELEDSEVPPSKKFCCLVTLTGGWSRAATGLGWSPAEAKDVAADNLLKLIPNDAQSL